MAVNNNVKKKIIAKTSGNELACKMLLQLLDQKDKGKQLKGTIDTTLRRIKAE